MSLSSLCWSVLSVGLWQSHLCQRCTLESADNPHHSSQILPHGPSKGRTPWSHYDLPMLSALCDSPFLEHFLNVFKQQLNTFLWHLICSLHKYHQLVLSGPGARAQLHCFPSSCARALACECWGWEARFSAGGPSCQFQLSTCTLSILSRTNSAFFKFYTG